MLAKRILFFDQPATVACDGRCEKAWGRNSRPTKRGRFLTDDELGTAPLDPGTYEGVDAKPKALGDRMNRWCVRECERCEITSPGSPDELIELPDFSKRVPA